MVLPEESLERAREALELAAKRLRAAKRRGGNAAELAQALDEAQRAVQAALRDIENDATP